MKKFLSLFILITGLAGAQDIDSLSTDSTGTDSLIVEPPAHTVGVFVQAGMDLAPTPGGMGLVSTMGAGIVYDKIQLIFLSSIYQGNYNTRLIFPNLFSLVYEYGGAFVSYSVIKKRKMEVAPFISFHKGDVVWEQTLTKEDFLREKFQSVRFGGSLRYHLLRFVKVELLAGYQKMSNIDLTGVNRRDFEGFLAGFNVKVGYFNQ